VPRRRYKTKTGHQNIDKPQREAQEKTEEHFNIFKVPTFNIEAICEHLNNSQTHITYTINISQ
jgi:hypothetical protein